MKSQPQKVHFPVAKPSTSLLLLPYESDVIITQSNFHIMILRGTLVLWHQSWFLIHGLFKEVLVEMV